MPVSVAFRDHVADLFAPFGEIKIKLMFGGAGIFHKDQMFGLIADERIYLKANDETRKAFEADELAKWARRAYEIAIAGRAKKPGAKRKASPRDLPLVSPRKSKK